MLGGNFTALPEGATIVISTDIECLGQLIHIKGRIKGFLIELVYLVMQYNIPASRRLWNFYLYGIQVYVHGVPMILE